MNEARASVARFILFWCGTVVVAIGLSYALNALWYIFGAWFQINYPLQAGIHDPATASELQGGLARWLMWYVPEVVMGGGVSLVGLFMMVNGKRKITTPDRSLAHFGLFWAGTVALAIGLGTFLFGVSTAVMAVWAEVNFPNEFWVNPGLLRGLWFPQLRYTMVYVLDGLVVLLIGIFMMKSGNRKLN